ncbi:hypothetical protein GC096_22075 [Paenibacillus sp. LMG 31461]|uniref:Uncharacterized protein n=1 Tax=Paenibacillus plantarum TaxID=2654975 RepID=A0ABX1XEB3_9BACL|nr:hypothetical protein [Paenibacillus plantarum]NOU66737.1 hypothetical protein [Paenibacillus plantarum]
MDTDIAMKSLFTAIYEQIKPTTDNLQVFSQDRTAFIIRSASPKMFSKFIKSIKEVNPDIFLYILTHSRDKEDVIKICGEDCEIIEYTHTGSYDVEYLKDKLQYIKSKSIDRFGLLYNNRYGIDYENVLEIMSSITEKELYVFNSYWELLRIDNPNLHIKSLKLMKAMSEWHWENIESR